MKRLQAPPVTSFLSSVQRLSVVSVVGLSMTALAGCSSMPSIGSIFAKDDTNAVKDEPADKLYNEALYSLNNQRYGDAVKRFDEVDKQHPYTDYSRKAILMSAYASYSNGDYETAVQAARRYLSLHPGSPDAAYAQFLIGISYYNQIPDVTRDQQRTERALVALNEVVQKWPKSEYADPARQRIEVAKDQLAGREMDVGRYYLQQRNYTGAINRFKNVITQFQTTRHVEEALARVAEAYMAMGIVAEAQTAGAVLGHNYPDSQWYKDTYTLVTSKGGEIREDKGSWISRAFKGVGLG